MQISTTVALVYYHEVEFRQETANFYYCSLTKCIGSAYRPQIVAALKVAHQLTNDNFIKKSTFRCDGGANGGITFASYCGDCVDGGAGKSDYCGPNHGTNCGAGLQYCGFNLMDRGK